MIYGNRKYPVQPSDGAGWRFDHHFTAVRVRKVRNFNLASNFFQILAARYRSNPTEGTERSRNEGVGGRSATINNNSMQSIEGGMEGKQIQNTKLEATCVLLVVITTVALT